MVVIKPKYSPHYPALVAACIILLFCSSESVFAKKSGNLPTQPDSADSLKMAEQDYLYLRGLERNRKNGDEEIRRLANISLFLPRTIAAGIFYSAGYGAHLIDESKIIDKAEDLFSEFLTSTSNR